MFPLNSRAPPPPPQDCSLNTCNKTNLSLHTISPQPPQQQPSQVGVPGTGLGARRLQGRGCGSCPVPSWGGQSEDGGPVPLRRAPLDRPLVPAGQPPGRIPGSRAWPLPGASWEKPRSAFPSAQIRTHQPTLLSALQAIAHARPRNKQAFLGPWLAVLPEPACRGLGGPWSGQGGGSLWRPKTQLRHTAPFLSLRSPDLYLPGPSQHTGDPCASELCPPVPRLGPGPL